MREFDFRVGGQDRLVGTWKDQFTSDYRSTYHDIVPDRRIVTAYDMLEGADAQLPATFRGVHGVVYQVAHGTLQMSLGRQQPERAGIQVEHDCELVK